jgi:HK97 family phage major capsid protein
VRPTVGNKHRAGLLSAATTGWGRLETGTGITDAAISVSSPGLDIDVHDVLALCQIGTDELDDTAEAARAAIVEAIGIAIGESEDAAFANGTGTGQPKGLALAANVARVAAGQKTTAAASATPVLADILGLPWKLPTRYRAGGVWLMSEDMAPKIAALTYANGSGIMPNAGQGQGPLGYPFSVVPGLPTAATAGTTDPSVWFINLQAAYRVVDRGPIVVTRLTQKYAELGLVGVIVKRRVGGDLVRPDAAAIYLL